MQHFQARAGLAACLWGKEELTKAGFPRVLVVSAHEQPRQHDEQQGRQKCDELHRTGRISGVGEAGLSSHQNTRELLKKTLSTLPCPKAKQQSVLCCPCSSTRTQSCCICSAQPVLWFSGSSCGRVLPWLVLGCPQAQYLSSPLPASPSISSVSSTRALSANPGSC